MAVGAGWCGAAETWTLKHSEHSKAQTEPPMPQRGSATLQVGYLVPMSYSLTPRGRMLRGYCDFSAGFSLVQSCNGLLPLAWFLNPWWHLSFLTFRQRPPPHYHLRTKNNSKEIWVKTCRRLHSRTNSKAVSHFGQKDISVKDVLAKWSFRPRTFRSKGLFGLGHFGQKDISTKRTFRPRTFWPKGHFCPGHFGQKDISVIWHK